jgi:hypothetical protein
MSTLAITYRKNPLYSEEVPEEPRLFATIDLSRYGVAAKITDLPIYYRHVAKPVGPIRVVYSTRVAGLLLEKGNLEGLVTVLDTCLGALIRFERLPEYVFHVGTNAWPIYQLSGQLVTRYPGGPVFSAPDIAELRIWLADHFKHIGRIQNRRELGILYFSQSDLQLYPPDCTLRPVTMPDIPVFPTKNGQGKQLVAPVNSHSIAVPTSEGAEVFDLHRKVGRYLVKQGRLADPYDITIRKLSPDAWTRVKSTLQPYEQALSYYAEANGRLPRRRVPVFKNARSLIAARKHDTGRTSLHLAPNIRGLQRRLGQELHREGVISSPDAVQVVPAQRHTPVSILDRLLQAPAVA